MVKERNKASKKDGECWGRTEKDETVRKDNNGRTHWEGSIWAKTHGRWGRRTHGERGGATCTAGAGAFQAEREYKTLSMQVCI